jgi:hypothetical protein
VDRFGWWPRCSCGRRRRGMGSCWRERKPCKVNVGARAVNLWAGDINGPGGAVVPVALSAPDLAAASLTGRMMSRAVADKCVSS